MYKISRIHQSIYLYYSLEYHFWSKILCCGGAGLTILNQQLALY